MIKNLAIKNFTVFSDANIEFSKGLNVIIGENSAGKSHLLKLAYAITHVCQQIGVQKKDEKPGHVYLSTSSELQRQIAAKLVGVLKPDSLGRLCRRGSGGRQRAEVSANFFAQKSRTPQLVRRRNSGLQFSFSTKSKKEVELLNRPVTFVFPAPIFLPAKETLTLYPGFVKLYEDRELSLDETYYDLCKSLSGALLKGKRAEATADFIGPLEEIMGGKIRMEAGRFYLNIPGQGNMEISLVAEGIRKVAMLAYLTANGSLNDKGILFWDEPETNLNPKLMVDISRALTELSRRGVQVIIATHSLFLMKQLSLLVESAEGGIPARFFALRKEEEGVVVEQGDTLSELETVVSLDEELALDDREQKYFYESAQ
jgi:predicted ATPase